MADASVYPKTLYTRQGSAREVINNGQEAWARLQGYTDPYVFSEYPRSLYMGGDRYKEERVVNSAAEEKAARKEGFRIIGEKE